MATGIRQRWLSPFSFLCCLILGAPLSALAQQGGIGGRVSDQSGGAGLEAARVILTGTSRIETTDREGHFLFRGVEPGTYQVRVLRVGYKPATQSATLAARGWTNKFGDTNWGDENAWASDWKADRATWADAALEAPLGEYAWRGWHYAWDARPGEHELCCRATDAAGNTQPLEPEWNVGGYANNAVQRVPVTVTAGP